MSKAKYKVNTGREQKKVEDVLCYQIRQSFVRGEVDAETALKSKGNFKHYGEWQSEKPPTFQERLKAQIDICLAENPPSMEAFLQAMAISKICNCGHSCPACHFAESL